MENCLIGQPQRHQRLIIRAGAKFARLDDDLTRTADEAQITDGNELLLQKPVRQ